MVATDGINSNLMQMSKSASKKPWMPMVILACILLVFGLIAARVVLDVKRKAWIEYTESNIRNISGFIESHRDEHGHYPPSLSELLSGVDAQFKEYLRAEIADRSDRRHEYLPSTNGFVIIVTKPGSLFSKEERMERRFKIGEAHEQFGGHPAQKE